MFLQETGSCYKSHVHCPNSPKFLMFDKSLGLKTSTSQYWLIVNVPPTGSNPCVHCLICIKVLGISEKMHSRLNCQPTIMPVSPKKIQAASSVELTLCMQFGGNDKWCRKCGPESTEVRLWWQESGKRRKWETIVKHVLHLTQDWWLKLKAALGIKWMNRASQHKHHKVLLFNNLWKYAYRHNFDNSSACCFIFSVFTFHNKSPRHTGYTALLHMSILLKGNSTK